MSLNGKVLRGYTHQEVIELFKAVREGPVELEISRRHRYYYKFILCKLFAKVRVTFLKRGPEV